MPLFPCTVQQIPTAEDILKQMAVCRSTGADPDRVKREIEEVIGLDCSNAIMASAKQVGRDGSECVSSVSSWERQELQRCCLCTAGLGCSAAVEASANHALRNWVEGRTWMPGEARPVRVLGCVGRLPPRVWEAVVGLRVQSNL